MHLLRAPVVPKSTKTTNSHSARGIEVRATMTRVVDLVLLADVCAHMVAQFQFLTAQITR
jgi:hypothetical protein